MNIVGYCEINKDATTGNGLNLESFIGKTCRVIEFSSNGGVLVVNHHGTGLAMFDKEDIGRKFECEEMGEYIFAPGMNEMTKMCYMAKVSARKGGWAPILKQMIILHSLHKGQFNDSVLWAKQ